MVTPPRTTLAAAAALWLGAAAAAHAQPMLPTRDVAVTYLVTLNGRQALQQMRWNAQTQMMRVDPPASGLYMITDYARHRVTIVNPRDHSLAEAPAPAATVAGGQGAPRSNAGADTVAGLACTDWATTDTERRPVLLCVTADGVTLRIKAGGQVLALARDVSFAAQDTALFAVPDGYRPISPSELPK